MTRSTHAEHADSDRSSVVLDLVAKGVIPLNNNDNASHSSGVRGERVDKLKEDPLRDSLKTREIPLRRYHDDDDGLPEFPEEEGPGAYAEGGTETETGQDPEPLQPIPAPATEPLTVASPVVVDLEVAQEVHSEEVSGNPSKTDPIWFCLPFGATLLACIIFVVVLPVVLLQQGTGNNDVSAPTSTASANVQYEFIVDLPSHTKDDIINDQKSPQARAYQWLLNDPFLHTYSPTRQVQRFALATFYHSTHGNKWENNQNWLEYNTSECTDWFNQVASLPEHVLTCHQDLSFNALALVGNGMFGTLPKELGLLSNLTGLVVGQSYIGGSVPLEIWKLPQLNVLALHQNLLTGTLEPEWFEAAQSTLYYMDLAGNRLQGSIPSEIGLLKIVANLGLGENMLTGSLPSQLGHLTTLQQQFTVGPNMLTGALPVELFESWIRVKELHLRANLFSGTLPTEIGLMSGLQQLYAYTNYLRGPLPSQLGALDKSLQRLVISDNLFTGKFPDAVWGLSRLEELMVQWNHFKGTLPHLVGRTLGGGSSRGMRAFDVRHNHFIGTIPSSIGLWNATLSLLGFSGNRFSGTLPSSVWECSNLKRLSVGGNLSGSIPGSLSMPNLLMINLTSSHISGTIPAEICSKLKELKFDCSVNMCGCDCRCGGE